MWLVAGIGIYLVYRHRKKLPLLGSRQIDWEAQQIKILRDAGELELMDELTEKLRARGRAASISEAL